MAEADWQAVDAALARRTAPLRIWLRDDDAVDDTPALRRLGALSGGTGMPVLLAVIPRGATPALAAWLADTPHITPCQHGYAHRNHAPAGERACELGGARADEAVLAELAEGRARLGDLFGTALSAVLVPPWNRIRDSLLPALPSLGYTTLSTFTGARAPAPAALPRWDCDLDIIDWRNGRRGRSEADCCARLAALVDTAGERPLGLLTHHLAHDATAWAFLEAVLRRLGEHPGVRFVGAADVPA